MCHIPLSAGHPDFNHHATLSSGIIWNRRCDISLTFHLRIKCHVPNSAGHFGLIRHASLISGIAHSRWCDQPLFVGCWIRWHLPNTTGLHRFNHLATSRPRIVNRCWSTSPLILNRQINHHITNSAEAPSFNNRTSSWSGFNIDHRSHLDRSTVVDLFITLNFTYTYLPRVFESAEIIRVLDFYPFDFAPLDFL